MYFSSFILLIFFLFFLSMTVLSCYEREIGVHVRVNINKKSFLAIKCVLGILLVFMGMVNSFWVHVILHRMGIFLFKTDMRDGKLFHICLSITFHCTCFSILKCQINIWYASYNLARFITNNNRFYLFVQSKQLILWLSTLNIRWLERATQITFQNNISYKLFNRS